MARRKRAPELLEMSRLIPCSCGALVSPVYITLHALDHHAVTVQRAARNVTLRCGCGAEVTADDWEVATWLARHMREMGPEHFRDAAVMGALARQGETV